MWTIEAELCLSIELACACEITYRPVYAKADKYTGIVRVSTRSKKPFRLQLLDALKIDYRRDDTGDDQHITLDLAAIKDVRLLENITAVQSDDARSYARKTLDKHGAAFAMRRHEMFLRHHRNAVEIHPLERLNATASLSQPRMSVHQNVATLKIRGQTIPVLSYRFAYDLDRKTFTNRGLYRHEDPRMDQFFPHPVETIDDIETIAHICDIDREAWYYTRTAHPAKQRDKRIDVFFTTPYNRPFRAFFNQISKKNLGRKLYFIPFYRNRAHIWENAVAASSLKHPATLVETVAEGIPRLLSQCVRTALLNHQSILVVDPGKRLSDVPPGALDLRHKNIPTPVFSPAADTASKPETYTETSIVAEDIGHRIHLLADQYSIMRTQAAIHGHYESQGMFHESIETRSRIHRFRQKDTVPLADVYEHLHDIAAIDHHLGTQHAQRMNKCEQAAYRHICDIVIDENAGAKRKNLIAALKQTHAFQRLKQLYPAFIVKNTQSLPYLHNAFDMVVLVEPTPEKALDIRYADKLTIVENIERFPSRSEDAVLPFLGSSLFNVLKDRAAHGVKYFSRGAPAILDGVVVHDVGAGDEHKKHISQADSEAISIALENTAFEVDVRTPFNAQKKALRHALKTPVETLHIPLSDKPLFVSLAIHPNTPHPTVDWLKNNPDIIRNISDNRPLSTLVFADVKTMQKHSAHHGRLFASLLHAKRYAGSAPIAFSMWRTWLRSILAKAQNGEAVFGRIPKEFPACLTRAQDVCTVYSASREPVMLFIGRACIQNESDYHALVERAHAQNIEWVSCRPDELGWLRRILTYVPGMRVKTSSGRGNAHD